ncbi:MAG: DMT family transporter [Chlorobi bacterium]|nr:DMT family transporter [Chlorobiota bacterium]
MLRELLLATVALLWAGTFLLVKRALPYADPIAFVTCRFALASGAALLIWSRSLSPLRKPGMWKYGLVLGTAYGIGFYLQTWGLQHTTITRSAFFTGTFVVFVPLLQRLIWRRSPSPREWWGVFLGSIGIGLMSSPDAGSLNAGDVATLLSSVVWSYYMGYLSYTGIERLGTIGTGPLVMLQCIVTTLIGILYLGGMQLAYSPSFAWKRLSIEWNPTVVAALVYTSIVATVVTTYIQTRVQPGVSAVRAALIFALEPVFAALLGAVVEGEQLRPMEALGAGCIVAAAVVPTITYQRAKRND